MLVITDLPDIMQSQGWPVAASAMRRWFGGTAWTMPPNVKEGRVLMTELPPSALEDNLLKMEWALSFGRIKSAYELLTTEKWNNPAATVRLAGLVRDEAMQRTKQGKNANDEWRFGDFDKPPKSVSATSQVNFLTVGALHDPLDDFYGAVGRGTLDVAVSGMVKRAKDGKQTITIDMLGVYLRDTYDFNGDQPLGAWTRNGIDRSTFDQFVNAYVRSYPAIATTTTTTPAPAGGKKDDPTQRYAVSNGDFRRFRAETGRGGDYVSVSDVRVLRLATPQVLELT